MDIVSAQEQGEGKAGNKAYLTPEEYIIEVGGVMIMCRDGVEIGAAAYHLITRTDFIPYPPQEEIVPTEEQEFIFSGEYSRDMWDSISSLDGISTGEEVAEVLYLICCRLQELEARIHPPVEDKEKP